MMPALSYNSRDSSPASSVSVCLRVRLSISQKPHVQISPHFFFWFTVAVARSFSDDNAVNYLHLILSRFITQVA